MAGSSGHLARRVAELRAEHERETKRQLVLAAYDRDGKAPTARQLDEQMAGYQPPADVELERQAGREFLAAVEVARRERDLARENLERVPGTVAKLREAAQAKLDSAEAAEAEARRLAEDAEAHLAAMAERAAELPEPLRAELLPVQPQEVARAFAEVAEVKAEEV